MRTIYNITGIVIINGAVIKVSDMHCGSFCPVGKASV